jgi:hypothetical protein
MVLVVLLRGFFAWYYPSSSSSHTKLNAPTPYQKVPLNDVSEEQNDDGGTDSGKDENEQEKTLSLTELPPRRITKLSHHKQHGHHVSVN